MTKPASVGLQILGGLLLLPGVVGFFLIPGAGPFMVALAGLALVVLGGRASRTKGDLGQ